MKKVLSIFVIVCLFSVLFSFLKSFAQESITLTTYYPAPYGVYREMRVNGLAVGSAYRYTPANISDGYLIVNGSVGIGTASPVRRLHVHGTGEIALLPGSSAATDSTAGLYWNSDSNYSIHRTAGPWTPNDYQQLLVDWQTGIILDPGSAYGKSYVEIPRGGLRVSNLNSSGWTSIVQFIGTAQTNNANLAVTKFDVGTDDDRVGFLWEHQNVANHRMWMGDDGYLYTRVSADPANDTDGRRFIQEDTVGNVGIGTISPNSTKGSPGYVDAQDVYLRETGTWASSAVGISCNWTGDKYNTLNISDGQLRGSSVCFKMTCTSGVVTSIQMDTKDNGYDCGD